jgi:hypothetical protein
MWKKLPDSFLLGTVSGIVTLGLFYILVAYVRILVVNHYQNPYLFMAPKAQLFAIFLNILLFRFVMISLDKEKFGRGILLATVSLSFLYFYFYFRYHQSII